MESLTIFANESFVWIASWTGLGIKASFGTWKFWTVAPWLPAAVGECSSVELLLALSGS